jgi:2-beta-glucuronyltransferase
VSARPDIVVIVSSHDYRTARRAGIHSVAKTLAELGHEVHFLSVGYSPISWLQKDSRCTLWRRANRAELANDVHCYLWRTALHPVNPDVPGLTLLATAMYRFYRRYPSRFIDNAFRSATVIIVESGLGVLLLARARALNRSARIIYLASDHLPTLGAHSVLQSELESSASIIDHACITSARMADRFAWANGKLFVVPHGLDPADFEGDTANPYSGGRNAVSVGSMLFDADFFIHAAGQFPDVTFHVIGSRSKCSFPPNVRVYPEIPFKDTIPYLKHATFGIAPYRFAPDCEYLCDTSLKLMQYDFLGLPAVCPHFAVGTSPNRIGYTPGDTESIRLAVSAALDPTRRLVPRPPLSWREATLQLLEPATLAGSPSCRGHSG